MAKLGKSDRFFTNPTLRDAEWNRAKQPPWPVAAVVLAIISVASYFAWYGSASQRNAGWAVGAFTILIYVGICWLKRTWARRHLRRVHGQAEP